MIQPRNIADKANADWTLLDKTGLKGLTINNTTGVGTFSDGAVITAGGLTISAGGLTITGNSTITGTLGGLTGLTVASGGLTVTAGGATITAGGLVVTAGRIREVMTPTDVDAQNHTLTAANILAGIVIHTSVTGGGTVTTDTAANIIAGIPLSADGQCLLCYYVNDGDQTLTFAGGTDVTPSDTGQTVATNESAILLFRRTSATTVAMHIFGA